MSSESSNCASIPVYDVCHKWSAWSADLTEWQDRAPEALAAMRSLPEGGRLRLRLSSRKEIRVGEVEVQRTATGYTATGSFTEQWDSPWSLKDILDIFHDVQAGEAQITAAAPPNCQVTTTFAATHKPTLEELITAVDAMEDLHIKQDERAWDTFVERLRQESR